MHWVCALLLICMAGCATSHRLSKAEAEGMFQSAVDSMDRGDYRMAVRRFQSVEDSNPNFPGLHHKLGICYAKVGLAQLSVDSLRAAVKEEPDEFDPKLDLAVALELSGMPAQAESIYLELLQREPGDRRVILNLGLLYSRQLKQPDKARPLFEKFMSIAADQPEAAEIRAWLDRHPASP